MISLHAIILVLEFPNKTMPPNSGKGLEGG